MKKCTACPSKEGVTTYIVRKRGVGTYVIAFCISCAEQHRQLKNVTEVNAVVGSRRSTKR